MYGPRFPGYYGMAHLLITKQIAQLKRRLKAKEAKHLRDVDALRAKIYDLESKKRDLCKHEWGRWEPSAGWAGPPQSRQCKKCGAVDTGEGLYK